MNQRLDLREPAEDGTVAYLIGELGGVVAHVVCRDGRWAVSTLTCLDSEAARLGLVEGGPVPAEMTRADFWYVAARVARAAGDPDCASGPAQEAGLEPTPAVDIAQAEVF